MAKTRKELEALLASELTAVELRRRAARICPLLLNQVRALPEGIDLVSFVSDCSKTNNRIALIDWINRQLDCPEFQAAAEYQPEESLLLDRLTGQISTRLAANDHDWEADR